MTKLAIASEWTKFWSVRATWWCLGSGALMMTLYAVVSGLSQQPDGDRPQAAHGIALTGAVYLVEFFVIAAATLFVTSEYASGSIRSTLQWVPVRSRVIVAKAAVLVPVLFAFGVLVSALGTGVATLAMSNGGLPSTFGQATSTALGMGAYFALLGLLCQGIAFMLRSAAGTLVMTIVLLLPLPLVLSQSVFHEASDYFPAFAGIYSMVPSGENEPLFGGVPPYSPLIGVLVCLAWAAAGLFGGTMLLKRRDA